MEKEINNINKDFFNSINELLKKARKEIHSSINLTMVHTYFEIGKRIIEEEQNGLSRASYGQCLIKKLSKYLTSQYGKGFSITNLKQMRKFYLFYSNKKNFKLSWSHYLRLMRIENEEERNFYEIESINNNWSLFELNRQFDTSLYERLALSRDKEKIRELALKGQLIEKSEDILKEPYVLEFLGLPELAVYSERELETRIIDNLQTFLLEMGKGFSFVGRQVRISYEEEHFYIDLVFYNRFLRCFVLIDLKIGKLKHQDIGQMQMYVNYYDRKIKLPDENKTIGILLCKDKNEALVKMTLPQDNDQIFASKYQTVLPSKEELMSWLI